MRQTSCPFCGFGRSWVVRRKKRKCKKCRREFSGNSYPITGFRVTKDVWQRAVATFLRERTEKRIAAEAGVSLKTAQRMAHHFRTTMTADISTPLLGPVEMDETYIGGQRKNKKLHIRRIAGKKGHGTDKLPIVGLFDRASGQVLTAVEPRKLDVNFIFGMARQHVVPGAEIYTDGFKMYRGFSRLGYRHQFVDHDGGELVRGHVHTNNIEGFWGILKRKLGCIGGMRRKYLYLFVGEIVWKFNRRSQSLEDQERTLIELVFRP